MGILIFCALGLLVAWLFVPSIRASAKRKAEGVSEVLLSTWRNWNEGHPTAAYDQETDEWAVSGWYPISITPGGRADAHYETPADRERRRHAQVVEALAEVRLTPGQEAHLRRLRND